MNRILFISVLFIIACNPNQDHSTKVVNNYHDMKPSLIHTVFFWTNEGTTDDQMKAFEEGLVKLGTCPQIQSFFWGPPAPTEARDVVDNTYDYAINVHFASKEDQDAYQVDPIHQEFIENHKDLWAKVVVYDNVVR